MKTAIVTGASSGLGAAISDALSVVGYTVFHYDYRHGQDVRIPQNILPHRDDPLDVLVNCAGVNYIDWMDDVVEDDWDAVMAVNAKAPFFMTQLYHANLARAKGAVVNIVSNAAHMPMRCSAAYNASKGAALILTKQLARELAAEGITVFSVSPNKLAGTTMSDGIDEQVMRVRGWTLEQTQKYQLAGLLTGRETPPEDCAEFIAFLLSEKRRHIALAGCDLPYGL